MPFMYSLVEIILVVGMWSKKNVKDTLLWYIESTVAFVMTY
jgi:hypothetical protein